MTEASNVHVWDTDVEPLHRYLDWYLPRLSEIRKDMSGGHNTRPDHVIAERAFVAGDFAALGTSDPDEPSTTFWWDGSRADRSTGVWLFHAIDGAAPYLWETSIVEAVRKMSLPEHEIVIDLPHVSMWWSYEYPYGYDHETFGTLRQIGTLVTALGVPEIDEDGTIHHDRPEFQISSTDLFAGEDGIRVLLKASAGEGLRCPMQTDARYNDYVGKLLAFLRSEHIAKETRQASRGYRRRGLVAEGDPATVGFITLRRPRYAATPPAGEPGSDYKVRWVVSGHIRNQWYPSRQEHAPVYISPHVKGPADKPLKTSVFKVVR